MYQTVNYVTGIKCKLCSRKYKTTGARRAPVVFGGRGLEMRIRRREATGFDSAGDQRPAVGPRSPM